ncbi:MAG: tetratricopeptide repeat protein [Coriobacteriales bacterium]|nr:tetratricopeptide repeat protein [Coriobacteriales bacterium]
MISKSFEEAKLAYDRGEYVEALKGFYICLKDDSATFESGDTGMVYYRLGNCLLKMRNFSEAAATYQKALLDSEYKEHAAVEVNLGKTLIGTGDFAQAIECFNRAIADTTYSKAYQAQMGLGSAYSRLGMIVEAGTAYRNAALDERNPNPTKALINLGSSFLLLNRPQDAIESYKAVFGFNPSKSSLFKTWENLGRAYVATGRYQEALDAFDEALAVGQFSLCDEAFADYTRAKQVIFGMSTERAAVLANGALGAGAGVGTGVGAVASAGAGVGAAGAGAAVGAGVGAAGAGAAGAATSAALAEAGQGAAGGAADGFVGNAYGAGNDFATFGATSATGYSDAGDSAFAAASGSSSLAFADYADDPYAPDTAFGNYGTGRSSSLDYASMLDGTDGYGAGNVPSAHDTGFFTASESDLVNMSKYQMKKERKLRHTGLKIALAVVIVLVLGLGTAVFGYSQGIGFPSQEAVVRDMFAAHAKGADVMPYWVVKTDAEKKAVNRIMDMVVASDSIDIVYENRSMSSSEIVVKVTLPQSGTVKYDVKLDRDLLGWKISGLDLLFDSTILAS